MVKRWFSMSCRVIVRKNCNNLYNLRKCLCVKRFCQRNIKLSSVKEYILYTKHQAFSSKTHASSNKAISLVFSWIEWYFEWLSEWITMTKPNSSHYGHFRELLCSDSVVRWAPFSDGLSLSLRHFDLSEWPAVYNFTTCNWFSVSCSCLSTLISI